MEEQGGFDFLEIPPVTLAAKEHRPAYEDTMAITILSQIRENVFDTVYEMIRKCQSGSLSSRILIVIMSQRITESDWVQRIRKNVGIRTTDKY